MKILHTLYDDPRNPWCGGGGALRTREISQRLAGKHDITVLSGAFPGAPREEFSNGIRTLRFGSDRSYSLSRLSFSCYASREISRSQTDLWIHQFSAFAPLCVPARLRRNSLLEFFHLMEEHATMKFPVWGRIARRAESRALRQHSDILTISPSATQELEKHAPHARFHLVYTGVDQQCFEAPWGEQDYILYFGRLDTYNKGIDILLNAFSALHTSDIRLILAGRGTTKRREELQSLADNLGIGERVEFTGSVSAEQKNELIGNALFVCMPSRYEGWGIVAIEAGAASKAVVGTDIPGLADAIRPGETGLLVPPENSTALSTAMQQLLSNGTLRRQLGRAGKKWAGSFTWDRVAIDQEKVYLAVAGQH